MRILIVEDHNDLRGAMKALFELQGGWHVCGEAIDGIEAISKAAELAPDLIVMDLSMPRMDGLQASAVISASAPHIPILVYTNYTLSPEQKSEAKKAGVWEILTKGGPPSQILHAVQELHVRAVARAAEQPGQAEELGTVPGGDLELEPEGS